MSDPANEPSFRLDVTGQPDAFEVQAFTGSESINAPFVFELELLIRDPELDLASLLYRPAWLSFGPGGEGIHGQLHGLEQREHGLPFRRCRVRLGPRLACLDQRFSQRIFTGLSVPQVIDQVLAEHGIGGRARRFELREDYPIQDFCTQYRESDLTFVQRLCAQSGIHYHFQHHPGGHCLVFGDSQASFQRGRELRFEAVGGQTFRLRGTCGAGRAPGAEGHSDLASLRCGALLPVRSHPIADCNQPWLLTRVEHQGTANTYRNRFWAVPCEAPFQVSPALTKPRMDSLQRAWVVHVDEDGPETARRIAVQFDWLYQGEGSALGHCWLPLAPELGDRAALKLDHGTEVLVSFIEGDPDQPMISGFLCGSTRAVGVTPDPPPETLLTLIQANMPLTLLCLLPGGGSFSQCRETVCTCRVVTRFNQRGVA